VNQDRIENELLLFYWWQTRTTAAVCARAPPGQRARTRHTRARDTWLPDKTRQEKCPEIRIFKNKAKYIKSHYEALWSSLSVPSKIDLCVALSGRMIRCAAVHIFYATEQWPTAPRSQNSVVESCRIIALKDGRETWARFYCLWESWRNCSRNSWQTKSFALWWGVQVHRSRAWKRRMSRYQNPLGCR
jgi:hypothetical protein